VNNRVWRVTAAIACLLAYSACRSRTSPAEYHRNAVLALRNGNASQAIDLARMAAKQCRPGTECSCAAGLLEAEALLRNEGQQAASAVLSKEAPQCSEFAALAARRIWLMGDLESARGAADRSDELLSRAAQMASAAGAWDVGFEADLSHARLFFVYRHDSGKAEATFRRVAEQATQRGDAYYEAIAWNGLGMMRLKDWRFDEAIPWFQRTLDAAERGGGQRLIVAAGQNLAICYSHLGSFDQAIQSRQRAIDLLGENGLLPYRVNLRWEMGNTYFQHDHAAKAVGFYRQALAIATTAADKAKIHRALAAAYANLQDWDGAEESNRQALSYANDDESRPLAEKNAADIAAGRGRYREACDLYQKAIADARNAPLVLWESHAELARLHAVHKNYTQANREFEKAIEIIDNNVEKVSTQNYRLTFFSLLIQFYQHYVQSLVDQQDYQHALEVADSSRARILLQRLALQRAPGKSTARDYVNIARASNSVLLFYWIAPEQSYLWVVTPDRIHPPVKLPPAEQIGQWVDQYRAFIEKRLADPLGSESAAGRQLYEALIAPAKSLIPPQSRVILLPDGALNWLNFETLPVYGNAPDQRPHYWIEDVRSVIAPSLSVLNREKARRARTADSLLIIGDPAPPDPEFPKLAYAAKEIETIEAKFPSAERKKFMGSMARPAAYQEAGPGRFSLMHFSAHAVANRESPLDSAIILSGDRDNFKLYARNIIDTPLRADLVTISACRSAGARTYSGEGLVGFAWAFLQAGARNVIAGLWDVTDSSTPGIMDVLYAKLASGMSPADALWHAKLALVHSNLGYRKPYYWGPFQVYTRDTQEPASAIVESAHSR
jgi:CHAT domain-containing protein